VRAERSHNEKGRNVRQLCALLALALLALGALASSATATHSGPELRVYGHGAQGTTRFDFSARLSDREAEKLALGEPHGYVRIETTLGSVSAEVLCLVVVANRATLVAKVTRASGTEFEFARELRVQVADNSPLPSGATSVPDQIAYLSTPFSSGGVCDAPLTGHPPITEGDIVVEQS
jgi:hypothetical protein